MAKRRAKAPTKAWGYTRVSTGAQAEHGVSLAAQRKSIEGYCELHDLELVCVFEDRGISGKSTNGRPGLHKAIEGACTAPGGVLVVYSLSRLARSTRDAIDITERIDKCGADLASISERIDSSTPTGRFFYRVMASLGELERDQVSERTKDALAHKRAKGERISGRIPFGFDLHDDSVTLLKNAAEQRTIKIIQRLRKKGLSLRAIGTELEKRGTPAKNGGKWHPKVLRDILDRE